MLIKDVLSDVLPIIENNAPSIATALVSPAVGIPEMVLSLLSQAFKIPKVDPTLVKNAISTYEHSGETLQGVEQDHALNIIKVLGLRQPSKLEINVKIDWETPNVSS